MPYPTEMSKYTALTSGPPPLPEIWQGFVKSYTTCVSQPVGLSQVPLLIHRVNADRFSFPAVCFDIIQF